MSITRQKQRLSTLFDGKNGWRYNRFEPPSTFVPASSLRLSPVTDAFAVIDRLIDTLPETAYPAEAQIRLNPAQKITTSFANGDELSIWRQAETGLPLKVQFSEGGSRATLTARTVEPLADPADELFGVGDWIRNR